MRVLNLEPREFSPRAKAEIERVAEYRALSPDILFGSSDFDAELAAADAIWTRLGFRIDEEIIRRAQRLRMVVSATTGLNHIDIEACGRRDIDVISLKGEIAFLEGVTATAELTLSLLLETFRKTGRAHQWVVEQGVFDRDRFRGLQLTGRTAGIVGLGRLGSMMAGYLHALRMAVIFCDPRPDEILGPLPFAQRMFFEEVLAQSDVICLHASDAPENRRMFNRAAFARMKRGAVFVNTARGEMVDEQALLEALQSGQLSAAAIDVLADEVERSRLGLAHPLIAYAREADNLVITPHIGGACRDAMDDAEYFIARKLCRRLTECS